MKKFFFHAGLIFLCFALPLQIALAMTVRFDQKISVNGNPIALVKVQSKADLMKAESEFQGMKLILVHNAKGTFSYSPLQKQAAKLPKAVEKTNLTAQLPHYLEFLEKNKAVKTGTETLEGRECDVYTFIEPVIRREAKAWIWREKKFPLKIEVASPGGATLIELINIQFDPQMKDADFELPGDVKVIEIPDTFAPPPPPNAGPVKTEKKPAAHS